MSEVKVFYVNELRECCYLLWDETKECVIVDPGMQNANENARLEKFITEKGLTPKMVLLTHAHFDHIMGLAFIEKRWGVPVMMKSADKKLLADAEKYFKMWEAEAELPSAETIDVEDGQSISFGNTKILAIATPGHTRGGMSYYVPKDNLLFTGDTLFAGSIGRTDLPGGDYDQLMESLLDKLIPTVDRDATVLPGHGYPTTIVQELQNNPFLRYE